MTVPLALLVGLASALVPVVSIEAYLVGLGALSQGWTVVLAVLAATAGHVLGKVLFYALGRGWLLGRLRARVSRRAHVPAAAGPDRPEPRQGPAAGLLARIDGLGGHPWPLAGAGLLSAVVGIPPFAVVAVLLGRLRLPLGAFLAVTVVGRLVRFSAVAGLATAALT